MKFGDYYSLAKPGIVYGNVLMTLGGFLLATRVDAFPLGANVPLLLWTLLGMALVIASAGAFNNYLDRDIDGAMARTRHRPLVAKRITTRASLTLGAVFGVLGFFILIAHVNIITAVVAAVGFVFYLFVYTLWSKRRSVFGTILGSIAGAVPPVAGYAAVSGRVDANALILFAILVLWQMPHFFAIGIYRREDYLNANIPIMPVKHGVRATKRAILAYVVAFAIVAILLGVMGYAGISYFVVAASLSIIWLIYSVSGFWTRDDRRWARQMFFISLAVIVFLFAAIAIDALFRA